MPTLKNEKPSPPPPVERGREDEQPEPPAPTERHKHAVIKPADAGVSHTEPGGTIHVG